MSGRREATHDGNIFWGDIWIVVGRIMSDRPPGVWRKQRQRSIFINLPLLHHIPRSLHRSSICVCRYVGGKIRVGESTREQKCEQKRKGERGLQPHVKLPMRMRSSACASGSLGSIALTNMSSQFWFLLASKPFSSILIFLLEEKKKKSVNI